MQKKKNSKLKREGRSIGDVPYLFFPFTIFSMYVYKDSLSFFFYPTSFCTGINTKTEKNPSKLEREGRSIRNVLLLFLSMNIYKDSIYFCFYSIAFCTRINTKTKQKKSKLKREGRSIRNVLLCNRPFFLHYYFSRNIYADSLSFFPIPLLLFRY